MSETRQEICPNIGGFTDCVLSRRVAANGDVTVQLGEFHDYSPRKIGTGELIRCVYSKSVMTFGNRGSASRFSNRKAV